MWKERTLVVNGKDDIMVPSVPTPDADIVSLTDAH
jgi:hypothetical protein